MKHSLSFDILMFVLVIAAYFAIIGDTLLTKGMFMDGLIYSNVANNLANGIGSFWHPVYTQTQFSAFYEHPPLAMGLCSLFYALFGSGVWVGRLYSMVMTLLSALLLIRLWVCLGYERRSGWIPLILWLLIPAVSLNSHENMLECTMGVFVLASVVLMIRGGWWRMVLAGLMLLCAFLSKGFVGLYPLVFPFVLFLFRDRNNAFTRSRAHAIQCAVHDFVVVLVSLAGSFALVCLVWRDAWPFLSHYIQNQVLANLDEPVVDNRWHIVVRFFEETVILWGIAVVALLILWFRRSKWLSSHGGQGVFSGSIASFVEMCPIDPSSVRVFFKMLVLTLCGVLPIMISLKQRSFYILTVYPFLACGTAALLHDPIVMLRRSVGKVALVVLSVVAAAVCVVAITINVMYCGKPGRDEVLIADMEKIVPHLQVDEVVSVDPGMGSEYSLHGYYYMQGRVSLDVRGGHRHLILDDSSLFASAGYDSAYTEIPLNTVKYKLYQKNDDGTQ